MRYKLPSTSYQCGFTLIELIVVVSITATLTTIVAVNFQTLRATQELRAARYDFISKLRELQGNILAGKNVPWQTVPAAAYTITLTANGSTYRVDYDIGAGSVFMEDLRFSEYGSSITPSSITLVPSGTAVNPAIIRISAPYGTIQIGGAANQVLRVELQHKNGFTNRVHIDGISGRITQAP